MDLVFFEFEQPQKESLQLVWIRSVSDFEKYKKNPELKKTVCFGIAKTDDLLFSKIKNMGFKVAVSAVNPSVAMWAVQHKTDFLVVPLDLPKPVIDLAIAKVASQNNVTITVMLSEWWNSPLFRWQSLFKNAFWLAKLCKKAKAQSIVASGAKTEWETKTPIERKLFAKWLGF